MAIDLDVHGNTKPLEAAVQAAINRIRRQPIKITVDDKGATQPLGNMKRAADEFSKSMEAANARILAFGASMAIINGVADAFKGMVRNLVQVEKSLADINVVMGLSNQNLEQFGDGLFKVAKETGAAFRVAADAATEYARQGLAVEETLKRTRDALVLTRLTGMDSAEAVKSLTAAMNTYGNQIKDTTQLVSKFAAVDVQFAVSAEDFAAAISRTGQAAKSAGVDIDELIGIVTSAQQQTARGGAVIGNALKTIFTKTGRTDTLNQLENLGIAVRDLEGNTIGAKRILSDLANTFDTLSEAQKAQITQTMGGLFHINILKAVLSDAAKQNGILANATQISANATDEAIQKNEQLRDTMAAMAGETGNAIKQLSVQIGELMLAPGMEKILNTVKSLAEGASDILGDGESAGNQFANGFLKGLGNVITGPGLVVLTTVFVKLFMTAAKFTKESLSSLIGVTSEAQKQKAIQTSLVALIGQNAALGKEMLRTDISRTEKEKILLGLLKMQTAEAERLNAVSQKLASTLYTKGYGPGLTQGRRRAYGHIPNYADPERAQAARGGYAAGSIRTMNMPGEGSVIYNSAETVKNFAGFKQPAIMPPQSSKAGQNYQQAFGNIHGFDPYAAGGYIPNYAGANLNTLRYQALEKVALSGKKWNDPSNQRILEGAWGKGVAPEQKTIFSATSDLYGTGSKSFAEFQKKLKNEKYIQNALAQAKAAMLVPPEDRGGGSAKYGTGKNKLIWPVYRLNLKDKDGPDSLHSEIFGSSKKIGARYATSIASLIGGNAITGAEFDTAFKKAEGTKGALSAATGAIFESAVNAALGYSADSPAENQGDFDVRGRADAGKLSKIFTGFSANMMLADYKNNSTSNSNRKSFYDKLIKEFGRKQTFLKTAAAGFIPNFADPLSDAIGREKAAGVPVSQIRVGSHSALMSKGNPLGLGVTNTYDEPNGLRDVFGANGFVPNYAVGDFMGSVFGKKNENVKYLDKEIKELRKNVNNYKKQIISLERGSIQLNDAQMRLELEEEQLASAINLREEEIKKSGKRQGGLVGKYSAASKWFEGTGVGKSLAGGGGMGLMIGAPMLAGLLQGGGAAKGGFGYAAGGALTGAATGASMGMMLGPLGIAVGGAVGAITGWIGALNESKEAIKKEKEERIKTQKQSMSQGFLSIAQGEELTSRLSSTKLSQQNLKDIGLTGSNTVAEGLRKAFGIMGSSQKQAPSISELASQGKSVDQGLEDYFLKPQRGTKYLTEEQTAQSMAALQKQARHYSSRQGYKEGMNIDELATFLYKQTGPLGALNKTIENIKKSQQFQKQAKTQIGAGPQQVGASKEVRNKLIDYLIENEKGPFSFNFGEGKGGLVDNLSKEKYSKILKGQKIKIGEQEFQADEAAIQANLSEEITRIEKEYLDKKTAQKNAIILQLNLQKAQIQAQKAASDAQFNIKSKFLEQSSLLDTQEKLMGGLMTEQQKAQMKYNKSLLKASEAYESGAAKAESELKIGIMQDIGQNVSLQDALKRELFKDEDPSGKSLMDLTSKMASMEYKELEKILMRIGLSDQKANEILTNRGLIYDNQLDTLKKQQNLTKEQASNELKINQILADRKQLIADLERDKRMSAEDVRSSQKIRGIDARVASAKRLAGIGPSYQTREQQEAFQIGEKRFAMEEKIKTLEENRTQALKDQELEKAKIEPTDQAEARLKELKTMQEAFGANPFDMQEMQSLQKSIDERSKKLEEIEQRTKNINAETDKEIAAEKELLAIEEKRLKAIRERQTGPGAFRNGISDGMAKVREQVEYMDYELAEKIPGAFADGLATAMSEGLSGAKDIGDALRDAGISFLQMIQKAMMQKAASNIVAMLPFSRGGNVRRYSQGGGVPAMVSNGEYIMGRDAVNKYGGAFMHGLNAGGRIPGFSNGGKLEGFQYKSGRAYQSKKMTGAFYGRGENVGLKEDASQIEGALQEKRRKEEEAVQKAKEAAARRNARVNQIISLIGSVAMAGITTGMMNKFGPQAPKLLAKAGVSSGQVESLMKSQNLSRMDASQLLINAKKGLPSAVARMNNINTGKGAGYTNWVNPTRPDENYYGGPIRKYASGGYISGAPGIDQIPAMLSEGEYVIRASSARQLGRPMLDRINAGKFNDGGPIEKVADNSETSGSGGNTNNINISVNIEGGSVKGESKSSDRGGVDVAAGSANQEGSLALADKIKQQVLSVIVEEQRPGGLLSE
tara:strand:+ start:1730 stop:8362 length:6633 start_codon:yes stop_codon:yes gene_type:complete